MLHILNVVVLISDFSHFHVCGRSAEGTFCGGTPSLFLGSLQPVMGATVERAFSRETWTQIQISAVNRLIGEVVQSRRRPLLGPSPG